MRLARDVDSWSGFHRLSPAQRAARIAFWATLSEEDTAALTSGHLATDDAAGLVENVVGTFPLPLGFAVHFVIDGRPFVVPMAVEESSVVAAASHGAKLAAKGGGFTTDVMEPVTVAQVELRGIQDQAAATRAIGAKALQWRADLDRMIPAMVRRGGGVRGITVREVPGRLVVHIEVDCRDAMGANTVNTLAEAMGPWLEEATGGEVGLRILTNLADTRLATARCTIPAAALGGDEVVEAMVEANRFAEADPYRAATHNKGIMNGVDPVVLATGNDWRAVEAAAHAYAARSGTYGPLTRYASSTEGLVAEVTLPMPVGTVGGVTRIHPVARACLRVLGDPGARQLAGIIAATGLAQNIAALRALSQEGIQRGHMALHATNIATQAGLGGAVAKDVARRMLEEGTISVSRAAELAGTRGEDRNR